MRINENGAEKRNCESKKRADNSGNFSIVIHEISYTVLRCEKNLFYVYFHPNSKESEFLFKIRHEKPNILSHILNPIDFQ